MLIKFKWVSKPSDIIGVYLNLTIVYFSSFQFQVDSDNGSESSIWTLQMSSNGTKDVIFTLKLEDSSTSKYLFTRFEVTLTSADTKIHAQLKETTHLFKKPCSVETEKNFQKIETLDLPFHDLLSHKLKYPFEIICNINVHIEEKTIDNVIFDLEKLLDDGRFSDFTVLTSTNKFKVHKYILAANSEVFSAMFEHDMLEKKNNSLIIKDFDDETVQQLLRYMYCGRVENLEKLSDSLLKASEKYLIKGLKIMCLEKICEKVTFNNAVEVLLLTINHKVDYLKSRILNFIVYNIEHIDKTNLKSLNDFDVLEEILVQTIKTHISSR